MRIPPAIAHRSEGVPPRLQSRWDIETLHGDEGRAAVEGKVERYDARAGLLHEVGEVSAGRPKLQRALAAKIVMAEIDLLLISQIPFALDVVAAWEIHGVIEEAVFELQAGVTLSESGLKLGLELTCIW